MEDESAADPVAQVAEPPLDAALRLAWDYSLAVREARAEPVVAGDSAALALVDRLNAIHAQIVVLVARRR